MTIDDGGGEVDEPAVVGAGALAQHLERGALVDGVALHQDPLGPLDQRTPAINQNIREILDVQTEEWGIKVTVVELRDIQLPESMQRSMARQAEAEREKRAKIIAAQGEALAAGELAHASDVMMAHPLALQLRNLQTLVEIAADKNSTVVFPAPLMSTIAELGAFLARESKAAALPVPSIAPTASSNGEPVSS